MAGSAPTSRGPLPGDLLRLSFASSQRDLFRMAGWSLWSACTGLEARFLALQVGLGAAAWGGSLGTQHGGRAGHMMDRVCACLIAPGHWAWRQEAWCGGIFQGPGASVPTTT